MLRKVETKTWPFVTEQEGKEDKKKYVNVNANMSALCVLFRLIYSIFLLLLAKSANVSHDKDSL